MQNRKVIIKGSCNYGKMSLYIPKSNNLIFKDIPPYFTVEIDLGAIRIRKKLTTQIIQEHVDKVMSLLIEENKALGLGHIKSKSRISFKRTKNILEVLLAHEKIKKVGMLYMIK